MLYAVRIAAVKKNAYLIKINEIIVIEENTTAEIL